MILTLGLSHHTAPVALRERFALAEGRVPATLAQLRESSLVEEAVLLSTCNRVELYAATTLEPKQVFAELIEFLRQVHDYRDPLAQEIYQLAEPHSVEHLFKVACGLDSMVLGETEILGQLKKAYEVAHQHRHTGPCLNRAFQRAFNVAKQVRSETLIQRGSVSVASVAVELAQKIFNTLTNRRVMVLGAGDTGEKAARALLSRGAQSVIVSNRNYDRAEALAQELGGRAVRFEDWAGECEKVDIVIASTAAPHPILNRAKLAPLMELRNNAPLLLIDIAVPRNVEPEVNFLENVYLYNVDDLQAIANDYLLQRKNEMTKCEEIIRARVQTLLRSGQLHGRSSTDRPALGHR